jgi:hypothetical protein
MSKLGKLRVQFKDPDSLYDAVQSHVKETLGGIGLDEREFEAVEEVRSERVREIASNWFEFGEYLRIEIDLDAEPPTARVLTVDE